MCAWSSPPSALPGISPTRGEIGWARAIASRSTLCSAPVHLRDVGVRDRGRQCLFVISPLVGEMPGRAEGGSRLGAPPSDDHV